MSSRWCRTVGRGLVALVVASILFVAASGGVSAETPRPLPDLALPGSFELVGTHATRTVSLPYDNDEPPSRLDLLLEKGVGDPDATVDVLLGSSRIARFEVTAAEPTTRSIDLAGRKPFGSDAVTLDLQFVSRFPATDGYCRGRATDPTVTVTDLSLVTADSPTPPISVGAFFPPTLSGATLWVPAQPSRSVAAAALRFAAGFGARYRGQNAPLRVAQIPEDGNVIPQNGNGYRDVVIRPGSGGNVKVIGASRSDGAPAALLVIPESGALASVEGVFSDLAAMGAGPEALFRQAPGAPLVPLLEQPVFDLGAPAAAVSGAADVSVSFSVPQAAFGGDVRAYVLRLLGRVVADRPATLTVHVNDRLVWSKRVNGSFSLKETLLGPLLSRYTSFRIEAHEIGVTGRCSAHNEISLQLSAQSTLTAELGQPAKTTWALLPQTLLPVVDVAIAPLEVGTLDAATAIVQDLVEASPHGLGTNLVDVDTVVKSERGGLVVRSGAVRALPHQRTLADRDVPFFNLRDRLVRLPAGTAVAQIVKAQARRIVVVSAAQATDVAFFAHTLVDFPNELAAHRGDTIIRSRDVNRDFQVSPVTADTEIAGDHTIAAPTKLWILSATLAVVALGFAAWRGRRRAP